jgi:hypothetical protein
MPDLILLEEFHLSVFVPDDEREDNDDPIPQVLDSPPFKRNFSRLFAWSSSSNPP